MDIFDALARITLAGTIFHRRSMSSLQLVRMKNLVCLVVGRIGLQHWSAVITYREEVIRIISVRRSPDEEVEVYEGERV